MLPDLLPDLGHHNVVHGRHGLILYNRNDLVVGRSAKVYGEYFESEVDVFRACVAPGDHVADVGANIGLHTLALARIVGPTGWVHAFEAQRQIFQALCANVALNSLPNVDCEPFAIDERGGVLVVDDVDCSVPENFGGISLRREGQGRTLPAMALDDYFQDRPLHFAKVDVEGMELACVSGGRRTFRRDHTVLYLENDRPEQSPALLETLLTLGYGIWWHLPRFFNPANHAGTDRRIHHEAFTDGGGPFLDSIGFAINILCLPPSRPLPEGASGLGLLELEDLEEHPLRRGPSRFHP